MRKYFFILTLFTLFILPNFSSAQGVAAGLTPEDIVLEMIPDNPGTHQRIYIKLNSYITDINSANITWTLNGKQEASGPGIKNFEFYTGNSSTLSNLDIQIRTRDGYVLNKNLRIRPIDIDLLWETDGYVPPFYKGKTLFSHENRITFIALPHISNSAGQEIGPKNLIYKWTKDGTVLENQSGYGKNTLSFNGSIISRQIVVTVNVTSPTTEITGFARSVVDPVDPIVLVYEKNPLYGIEFQKALSGALEMKNNKEVTLISIPYYFGAFGPTDYNLSYTWSINGRKIDSNNSNVQTFVKKEGISGQSNISLSVENANRILQSAKNAFSIKFEDEKINSNNNLF